MYIWGQFCKKALWRYLLSSCTWLESRMKFLAKWNYFLRELKVNNVKQSLKPYISVPYWEGCQMRIFILVFQSTGQFSLAFYSLGLHSLPRDVATRYPYYFSSLRRADVSSSLRHNKTHLWWRPAKMAGVTLSTVAFSIDVSRKWCDQISWNKMVDDTVRQPPSAGT